MKYSTTYVIKMFLLHSSDLFKLSLNLVKANRGGKMYLMRVL